MKLLLLTQDHEWYGNDEGTEGRWKPKGGSWIEVAQFDRIEISEIATMVAKFRPACEINNSQFRSQVIAHMILVDDELTDQEKLEIEYEGKIRYGRSYLFEGRVVDGCWYRQHRGELVVA
jgi:hypothetical protein